MKRTTRSLSQFHIFKPTESSLVSPIFHTDLAEILSLCEDEVSWNMDESPRHIMTSLLVAVKDVDGNSNQDGGRKLFKSMACSYVIAAAGPAQPDVRAEPYNGATCLWERNEGVGENYQVHFVRPKWYFLLFSIFLWSAKGLGCSLRSQEYLFWVLASKAGHWCSKVWQ